MMPNKKSMIATKLALLVPAIVLVACEENTASVQTTADTSGLIGSVVGESSGNSAALDVRVTGGNSASVSIKTGIPNASCNILDEDGTTLNVVFYADDHGIIHFSVQPSDSDAVKKALITCSSTGGQSFRRALRISRNDRNPSSASEITADDSIQSEDNVRSPLSGDPLVPSQEQLTAAGYPPRPNPQLSPAAYEQWLRIVSHPAIRVDGKPVQTRRFNRISASTAQGVVKQGISNATSTNWSGLVLDNPGSVYDTVYGQWTIPKVTTGIQTSQFYSFWAGLDGWGSGDIVQDGVECQAVFGRAGTFIFYGAWIEYFPASSVGLSNLPVAANDEMFTMVSVGDSAGTTNPFGGYGWYYIQDITNGRFYSGSIAKPSGAPAFVGNSAEWVIERPTVNGSLFPLAKYVSGTMSVAASNFNDGNRISHNFSTDAFQNVSMYAGADLLSKVAETSASSMQFTWVNFY